jgi:uncharacterized SAM-binding protein YcdF (DUF218 family)
MQAGFAPVLVMLEGVPPSGSALNATKALMANLDIEFPVVGIGRATDTRDEALLVSQYARKKGWKKILLVTSPTHSRRALLTFRHTGLQVVSSPCRSTAFDLENLNTPIDRIPAFAAAIREIVGLRVYRYRGWI